MYNVRVKIKKGASRKELKMRKSEQMVKSVYEIKCWWGDDCEDRTIRYVVASSEEEADQKMKEYADTLKAEGCEELHWIPENHIVEMDWVIV